MVPKTVTLQLLLPIPFVCLQRRGRVFSHLFLFDVRGIGFSRPFEISFYKVTLRFFVDHV